MNPTTVDLRQLVSRAIRSNWPAFEREHPHLAAAIDQQLLVEEAVRSISDDPEYQLALAQAAAAGVVASEVADLVARLVGRWLRGLL
jgi:hypothetical protein